MTTNVVISNHRNSMFDNLKALLIVLVLFGHCLEEISVVGHYATVRAILYSFHMPVFIFISGYFSNEKSSHYYENTICSCLLPYLLFNSLYCFISSHSVFVDVLTPRYLFWYLFSLFLWRLFLPILRCVRFILPISILLGLYCGVLHSADRFLSISRTISFLPYFIFGWQAAHTNLIYKIRRISPFIWATISIVLLTVVGFLQHINMFPVKIYENIQCYHCSNVSIPLGIVSRLFGYFIGFLLIMSLVGLIPDKRRIWTFWGETTITTYIGSAFVGKALFYFIGTDLITELKSNISIGILVAVFFFVVIVVVCGNKMVYKQYQKILLPLKRIIKQPIT